MTCAIDVARYLIHKAAAEVEPEYLTPLRLQKLLYYAQGWCLAVHRRPLFLEPIEAWPQGPVVREVYGHFANHGGNEIYPISQIPIPAITSEEDRILIESIWETYKVYSANMLRRMTHAEAPWASARVGLEATAACTEGISNESLREYFESRYEDDSRNLIGLDELRATAEEFRTGRGVPLEAVLKGLGMADALRHRTGQQGAAATA